VDHNQIGRREFVTAAMGLLAAGCSSSGGLLGRAYPDITPVPSSDHDRYTADRWQPRVGGQRPAIYRQKATLAVVPRHFWTATQPIANRVVPMASVGRITVHHEGSSPFEHDDVAGTIARISKIRRPMYKVAGGAILVTTTSSIGQAASGKVALSVFRALTLKIKMLRIWA